MQSILFVLRARKYDYLYGPAHNQSTQAFFNLMQNVIGPLPQELQPICSGDAAVNLCKDQIISMWRSGGILCN